MSFADEHVEPARPTHLLFRCRRCLGLHALESDAAEEQLQRLVTENRTVMTVRCEHDLALAVAEVIGVGPGVWPPQLPERAEQQVIIKEKKR